MATIVKRFMAGEGGEGACNWKDLVWWSVLLFLWKIHDSYSKTSGLF